MKKLVLGMIFAATVFCGFASNPISDFKYTLSNDGNGVVITKYIGKSKIVEFPSEIEGFPVIKLGQWERIIDSETTVFEKVVVPDSVTVIGDYAFENLSIKRLIIPNSVKSIGLSALTRIEYLEELVLPSSLNQRMFDITLSGTCNLEEIRIPASTSPYYSVTVAMPESERLSNVSKITFCNGVKEIDIRGNLKNVNEIIVPESIEYLFGRILLNQTTKFVFQNPGKRIGFSKMAFDYSYQERLDIVISENCSLREMKNIQDFWKNLGYDRSFWKKNF